MKDLGRHLRAFALLALALFSGVTHAASQHQDSRTFTTSGTVTAGERVYLTSTGAVATAGVANTAIGVARSTEVSGGLVAVKLLYPTIAFTTSGTTNAGDVVYPAASGKISVTKAGCALGVAMTTTTATGSECEVSLWPTTTVWPSSIYRSTERTATGSEETIAHGLAVTPQIVLCEPSFLTTGSWTVTHGTHTATNVLITVAPANVKYRVIAIK